MFAKLKKMLASNIPRSPRTFFCVIVLVFVPGGILIAPLLIGRRLKRETPLTAPDGHADKCSIKDDHEGSNAERLTRGVEYTTLQAVETDSEPDPRW